MSVLSARRDKKIACIVVAGPYRTGKSFIANRFVGKGNGEGFEIGSTTRSCTKGIWMWSEPIPVNDETEALLLDTEGLHAAEGDSSVDAKIFTLSVLLASVFVFNQIGHITEGSLEELSFVLQLTDMVSSGEGDDLGQYFPQLLWVLRDFTLDLGSKTSSEYLDSALQRIEGHGSDADRKNQIRENIKRYFSDRECYQLVRPVFNEADLAGIDSLDQSLLRPEFTDAISGIVTRVLTRPKLKTVQGKHLTGSMLLDLAYDYVEAMNEREVPAIVSSFQRVAHAEARKFSDELFTQTLKELELKLPRSGMPFEDAEISIALRELEEKCHKKLCLKLYDIAHISVVTEILEGFLKKLHIEVEEVRANNRVASKEFNTTLLEKLLKANPFPVINHTGDIPPNLPTTYQDCFEKLLREYQVAGRGPAKSASFLEFFESQLIEEFSKLGRSVEDAFYEASTEIQKYIQEYQSSQEHLR